MSAVAKMRTCKEAYEEIKRLDPNTSINPYTVRQLYLEGNVPTIRVGKLRLMDFDKLMSYLRGDYISAKQIS